MCPGTCVLGNQNITDKEIRDLIISGLIAYRAQYTPVTKAKFVTIAMHNINRL